PEAVTQNGHGHTPGNVFLAAELPADPRCHAQDPEVPRRDPLLLDVLRAVVGGEVGPAWPAVGRHIQAGDVVANGLEEGAGLRSVDIFGTAATEGGDHYGEPVRLRIGRAAQQNR